jgi:hypothetical protein
LDNDTFQIILSAFSILFGSINFLSSRKNSDELIKLESKCYIALTKKYESIINQYIDHFSNEINRILLLYLFKSNDSVELSELDIRKRNFDFEDIYKSIFRINNHMKFLYRASLRIRVTEVVSLILVSMISAFILDIFLSHFKLPDWFYTIFVLYAIISILLFLLNFILLNRTIDKMKREYYDVQARV